MRKYIRILIIITGICLMIRAYYYYCGAPCDMELRDGSTIRVPVKFTRDKWVTTPWGHYLDTDPGKYYRILRDRERMVCDLAYNVLNDHMSYDSIVILLGPGEPNIPSNSRLNGDFKDKRALNEMTIDKGVLVYPVGLNASGNNYLILQFKDGYYWKCQRREAR